MLDSVPAVPGETLSRVALSDTSIDLLRKLWDQYGPLMFHQSGGCCDGSSPMFYQRGEFRTGAQDVLLGEVANAQGAYSAHHIWTETTAHIRLLPRQHPRPVETAHRLRLPPDSSRSSGYVPTIGLTCSFVTLAQRSPTTR